MKNLLAIKKNKLKILHRFLVRSTNRQTAVTINGEEYKLNTNQLNEIVRMEYVETIVAHKKAKV